MTRVLAQSSGASLDAVASNSQQATNTLTFSHTVGTGSNRMLAVSISCQDSNTNNLPVTGVTFQNIALTKGFSDPVNATLHTHSEIWYLMAPPSGNGNIVITTTGNIWIGAVSSSWTGILQSTVTVTTPGSGIPSSAVVSFDMMKFQKDTSQNQMTAAGIANLMNLVKNNFPGVTHIACSTMLNSTAEINAVNSQQIGVAGSSAPLTQEAYTDLWFQGIHNAGYSIMLRNVDGFIDSSNVGGNSGDYNLIVQSNTPQHWVTRIINFLTLHQANIRNGDIVSCDPECDGHINYGGGANPIDSGSHAYTSDYNSFWQLCYQQVATWAANAGFTNVVCHQSCNGTSVNNSAPAAGGGVGNGVVVDGVTILTGGSELLSAATLAITKAINVDWYNWQETSISQPPPDEATYIQWYEASLDYWWNNIYAKQYPIMVQEWGDTRGTTSGSVQASDPDLSGNMADQVFFPRLRSGEMYAINFWDFFDTPQEGNISAQGDNIGYINGGGTISLNPKGAYLATIFQKWFGSGSGSTTTTTTGIDAGLSEQGTGGNPVVPLVTVAGNTLVIDALSSESALASSNQTVLATSEGQAFENVAASYTFLTSSGQHNIQENLGATAVYSLSAVSFQTVAPGGQRVDIASSRTTAGHRNTASGRGRA